MAATVAEERKDWELQKESELRLEVDDNQQVIIRVSEWGGCTRRAGRGNGAQGTRVNSTASNSYCWRL